MQIPIDSVDCDVAMRRAVEFSQTQCRLVLASASPRRAALLSERGFRFVAIASQDGAEERALAQARELENPRDLVALLADAKTRSVVERILRGERDVERTLARAFSAEGDATRMIVALGCDTIATIDGEVLGKPSDRADAERMLRKLSGSVHSTLTGTSLAAITFGDGARTARVVARVSDVARVDLRMSTLSESQLQDYLASGLWQGKAGAFGYQDGNDWLEILEGGDATAVVGLPTRSLPFYLFELARAAERGEKSSY